MEEKQKGFVDDGPNVRLRFGEKDNYKYKNKSMVQSLMGGDPIACMSCDRAVWYEYRSVYTHIVMSWLMIQGDLWEMVSKLIS